MNIKKYVPQIAILTIFIFIIGFIMNRYSILKQENSLLKSDLQQTRNNLNNARAKGLKNQNLLDKLQTDFLNTTVNEIPPQTENFKCYTNTELNQFYLENKILKHLNISNRTIEMVCKKDKANNIIVASQAVGNKTEVKLDNLRVSFYSIIGDELIGSDRDVLFESNGDSTGEYGFNKTFKLIKWSRNGSILYSINQAYPNRQIWVYYKPFNTQESELKEWCDVNEFTPGSSKLEFDACKRFLIDKKSLYLD